MSMLGFRTICAGLIVGALAGCSSETGSDAGLPKLLFSSLSSTFKQSKTVPERVVVTPQMHAKIVTPVLQVNPVATGGSDFLQRSIRRDDSSVGVVEVWKSSDNAQLFLRNGVVIGTRGIGRDIIAADANYTVRALRARTGSSGLRHFEISDGDVTSTKTTYQCDMKNLGNEVITVVRQRFNVSQFSETCRADTAEVPVINNEYWVEKSTGIVRKSNQWIGPEVGYFEMILLKN